MKIVIIGSGWLGTPLAEHLSGFGHSVSVTYRSNEPAVSHAIKAFRLSDWPADLKLVIREANCIVFAFPPPKTETNTHAKVCLEIAALANPDCRFLFTSTTGAYPDGDLTYTEETDLTGATNKHLETERELRSKLNDRLTIVRLAGLVGGNRFPARNMSASGKTYNGSEKVNLLHLADAVGIFSFLIEQDIHIPLLNACSPVHPEKGEYYTWMAEKLGIAPPLFENGPGGKIIDSSRSVILGYTYQFANPFDFPVISLTA